jgi:hypothetical protein
MLLANAAGRVARLRNQGPRAAIVESWIAGQDGKLSEFSCSSLATLALCCRCAGPEQWSCVEHQLPRPCCEVWRAIAPTRHSSESERGEENLSCRVGRCARGGGGPGSWSWGRCGRSLGWSKAEEAEKGDTIEGQVMSAWRPQAVRADRG